MRNTTQLELFKRIALWRIRLLLALTLGVSLVLTGCLEQPPASRTNPLAERLRPKPVSLGPNGLTITLAYLERPPGDPELNHELWQSADEEALEIAQRQRLSAAGFRVAVIGNQFPPALKELLDENEFGPMQSEMVQIQSGNPTQVQTSIAYANWPHEETAAEGNYQNAVASLRIVPRIKSDGCVQLTVTPEIEHGQPRRTFVPSDASRGPLGWSIEVGRQTRTFDDLVFQIKLRADQHLLLGCTPDDRHSLGAIFFASQTDDRPIQRAVLLQTAASREAISARVR